MWTFTIVWVIGIAIAAAVLSSLGLLQVYWTLFVFPYVCVASTLCYITYTCLACQSNTYRAVNQKGRQRSINEALQAWKQYRKEPAFVLVSVHCYHVETRTHTDSKGRRHTTHHTVTTFRADVELPCVTEDVSEVLDRDSFDHGPLAKGSLVTIETEFVFSNKGKAALNHVKDWLHETNVHRDRRIDVTHTVKNIEPEPMLVALHKEDIDDAVSKSHLKCAICFGCFDCSRRKFLRRFPELEAKLSKKIHPVPYATTLQLNVTANRFDADVDMEQELPQFITEKQLPKGEFVVAYDQGPDGYYDEVDEVDDVNESMDEEAQRPRGRGSAGKGRGRGARGGAKAGAKGRPRPGGMAKAAAGSASQEVAPSSAGSVELEATASGSDGGTAAAANASQSA